MDDFSLPPIGNAYRELLDRKRILKYASLLGKEGIAWWFEMKIPEIAAHLQPLAKYAKIPLVKPPPRLMFLAETVKPAMSPETFDKLFRAFEKQGDVEAMAAAACAGATSIWDSGVNFERFTPWHERITKLLDGAAPISDLTRAGLLSFRGQAELTFHGDMEKSLRTYRELMILAEKAGSLSLKVFSAAAQVYPLLWLGRASEIEALMMSVEPLRNRPEVSLFCNVYFLTSLGLGLTVNGEHERGEVVLKNLVEQPFYNLLSPSIQLLGLGHLLTALAFQDKTEEVRELARRILDISTPMDNSFHNSYAHYCVGVAELLIGEPRKALAHAREATGRGKASGSPIPKRMNPLLEGQALIDLGQTVEGAAILKEWIEKWKDAGFILHASAGFVELAALALKKGKVEEARENYEKSLSVLPRGERPPRLHRPPVFIDDLEKALYPAGGGVEILTDPSGAAVRIRTFGELVLEVNGEKIYDRKWRGRATKTLLKAIVALGGKKISSEAIIDMLWPEADGGAASQNLKVAIHRLKRIGLTEGEEPLQWLVVKHKSVSLSGALCYVDSIHFENGFPAMMNNGAGVNRLAELLSLYTDDFLANDDSEPWIVNHRESLRNKFVNGVILLGDLALKEGAHETAIPYLEKAIDRNPLREELYERMMELHLTQGAHSKALVVFRQAEEILKLELGVQPGPGLAALAEKAHIGAV